MVEGNNADGRFRVFFVVFFFFSSSLSIVLPKVAATQVQE